MLYFIVKRYFSTSANINMFMDIFCCKLNNERFSNFIFIVINCSRVRKCPQNTFIGEYVPLQ